MMVKTKKQTQKTKVKIGKLKLAKESIRELTAHETKKVRGGLLPASNMCDTGGGISAYQIGGCRKPNGGLLD